MLIESINRILIVDDHPIVAEAISAAISTVGGFTSVYASSAEQMRAHLNVRESEKNIELVFLDVHLPDANGVDLILELVQQHRVRVIVVSGQDDAATINRCIKNGAVGFVQKSSQLQSYRSALTAVLAGGQYFPVERIASGGLQNANIINSLSDRQRQILDLIIRGQSNRQISQKLCLAEGTIKNRVSELLEHFNVASRVQIIFAASQLGYKPHAS
jgi:DNA-binding NarL/FixJ family response regulator